MLQFLATLSAAPIATTIFYVSPSGNDTHNGETPTTAFRTISKCAEAVSFPSSSASTTCLVSPGVYREAVELPLLTTNARTFAANPASSSGGGPVVISGAELFPAATTAWTRLAGTSAPIYHTHLALPQGLPRLDQLFVNGSMVHEARWPNAGARFENDAANVVSTKYWSLLQPGSQYGGVVDENLAAASSKSGIDSRPFSWSGATATLNVGEQFYTYTRAVQNHVAGSGLFNYSRDFPGNPPNATWLRWAGMQYFLSGKLEALDAPGEWFHDAATATLYLWSPDDASPAHSHVEYKAREYGLFAKHDSQLNVADLTVRGIDFMASTFTFHNCTRCTFRDIALAYPTFNSTIPEQKANGDPAKGTATRTEVRGDRNTLSRITLKYSPNDGLVIGGTNSQAEDILIEYVDWLGTLDYKPLGLSGTNMTLIKATVGYFGNAGVVTSVPNCLPSGIQVPPLPPPPIPRPMIPARVLQVSYSRIHHGGRVGLDTAGLYSGGWATAGTHWHHNWVHDHREKCVRLDDQSRNATLHHLVAWNCGMGTQGGTQRHAGIGLILKGDGHTVYANTFFETNQSSMCVPACPEPLKAFRKQFPLAKSQNFRSNFFNIALSNGDAGKPCSCKSNWTNSSAGGNNSAVDSFPGAPSENALGLTDVAHFDFRPTSASPLVDQGIVWAPFTDGFHGRAPDLGAYESGGQRWVAGCTHDPACGGI